MSHRPSLLATVCASVIALTPSPALAAAGSLDPTFSDDGRTVTPAEPFIVEQAEDVAVQPDGKIVVVGWSENVDTFEIEIRAARYLEDGTPDPDFGGGDGIVVLPIAGDASGYAVAFLSDQRIAIAGSVRLGVTDYDFAAFLLTSAGDLDTSFDGDGIAIVRFGAQPDVARGIDVDGSDRIVLAGQVETATELRMGVVRLTSSGVPDTAFSSDGKRTVRFRGQAQARDVEIQANGQIVLAGRRQTGGFAIARVLDGGAMDTAFSGDGRVVTGAAYGANAVTLQSDGKIVAAGYGLGASVDYMLVRYRRSGSLDRTFHRDGIVTTDFDGAEDIAWDVEVQPRGNILAVGHVEVNGRQRFGIVRYRPSGVRDVAFSGDGRASQVRGVAFGSALDDVPRLVVAGYITGNMGTARYLLR